MTTPHGTLGKPINMSSQGKPPTLPPTQEGGDATSSQRTNEEMVRKLLQMNPTLRQGQSTEELVHKLNQKTPAVPASTAPTARGASTAAEVIDLVAELDALRVEFEQQHHALIQKKRDIEGQQANLLQERKAMRIQVKTELIAAIKRIDRNLTDRKNQQLLAKEQAFLIDIGYSTDDLLK